MRPVKVEIIGCGTISGIYLENMTTRYKWLEVAACADMYVDKAKETAGKFGVAKACSVDELLADPAVEIVINLTIPAAHYEINMAALKANKHVYCEKPLAMTLGQGKEIVDYARKNNLLIGCAPDTFMGAGLQTCRKAIEDGWIGKPLFATANFVCRGHEPWHPAPAFYYKEGAGPMMDMGPYYLTAMVSLLGPIRKTFCLAKKSFEQRTITSTSPLKGETIDVEVPTHYAGLIEFASGVTANINMSFDVWQSDLPMFEIHGSEGSMSVPDPNFFGGPVKVLRGEAMLDAIDGLEVGDAVDKFHSPEMKDLFKDMPLPYHQMVNMRGLGVLDMAYAIAENRPHRASGDLAYHVLEGLISFDVSARTGQAYEMQSTCVSPAVLPTGFAIGELD